MSLCLLHGFWGQPTDWQKVIVGLRDKSDIYVPDLYSKGLLGPENSIPEWTDNFIRIMERRSTGQPIDLVAYSMGGRLALHAILKRPELFRRVLFLSVRPAIRPEERADRAEWIRQWRHNFLDWTWSDLLADWEAQEVFKGTQGLGRRCDDSMRAYLITTIDKWSLLHHTFGWEDLKKLPATVDWYYGAADQKMQPVLKDLQALGLKGQKKIIEGAGHRILGDAPEVVIDWIQRETGEAHE